MKDIRILNLGRIPYVEVWELQRSLQRALIDGTGEQALILCEHDPVITVGRSAKSENLLVSQETLCAKGVSLFSIERGGDITYHGPGQIVGYPILNLNYLKRDVGWYMRTLEEVIIQTLQQFNVPGMRAPGRTGVWTEHTYDGSFNPQRKIASIGVRISRWCTLHGFGLNVLDCTEGFSLINPCGFTDVLMTSMEAEQMHLGLSASSPEMLCAQTYMALEEVFCEIFGLTGRREPLPTLGVKA